MILWERITGIEPVSTAWQAVIIPLYHIRKNEGEYFSETLSIKTIRTHNNNQNRNPKPSTCPSSSVKLHNTRVMPSARLCLTAGVLVEGFEPPTISV